jgi:hypothetical protein
MCVLCVCDECNEEKYKIEKKKKLLSGVFVRYVGMCVMLLESHQQSWNDDDEQRRRDAQTTPNDDDDNDDDDEGDERYINTPGAAPPTTTATAVTTVFNDYCAEQRQSQWWRSSHPRPPADTENTIRALTLLPVLLKNENEFSFFSACAHSALPFDSAFADITGLAGWNGSSRKVW